MLSSSRFDFLNRNRVALLMFAVMACLLSLHCSDSDDVINTSGPYSLRFSLESGFQGPHGGDTVTWALIRSDTLVQEATGSGTISFTANPSFTLSTGNVMEFGVDYEIHYWIDANTGGGTPGVCDDETIDPQWIKVFSGPTSDVVFIALYTPDLVTSVCDTFVP